MRQKSLNLYLSHLAAIWGPILLLLLIVVTYSNSFHGAFVFDDRTEVLEAGPVRSIEGVVRWPLAHPTRTVGDLTFLLNRRWGGDSPVGYHVVNLALHCAVALLLLGILRRILGRIPPLELSKETAEMLALAITVIWALHPIQTQAVTYIVQRHEILASLFYLGTLYAYIRAREADQPAYWRGICLGSALLGMASKEIMVTAPLAILAYEGLIRRTSFRQFQQSALRFWILLALTPLVTVALVLLAVQIVPVPGGVLSVTATPCRYALTQAGVLAHYLGLIVWPRPLCLDYGWPIAREGVDVVLPLIPVIGALGVTVYGIFQRRGWAFLPVVFGLILLPTSSLLPLPDAAMEHRMYLPSAWVLTGLVCGAGWVLQRFIAPSARWVKIVGMVFLLCLMGGEIWITRERNQDYVEPVRLWRGALEVNPENPRAWFHLAGAYRDAGRVDTARLAMAGLLAMVPDYSSADPAQLAEQARLDPEERRRIRYFALAHSFLGVLDLNQNLPDSALVHLQNAVRVYPDPQALYCLAQVHYRMGAWAEAISVCERELASDPNNIEGWRLRSMISKKQGEERQTAMALGKVLLLSPKDRQARYELAWLWTTAKDPELRRPADALRVARELWVESQEQSPKVRELLDAAQRIAPHE